MFQIDNIYMFYHLNFRKMKYLFFIFSIILVIGCNYPKTSKCIRSNLTQLENIPLAETKWQCKIAEGCINVYEFKIDGNYKFYSCEMEDSFYGSYFFIQDTLILDEKGNTNHVSDEKYNVSRKRYYAVIKDCKLTHLKMYEFFNGKFVLSNFKFDEKYYYTKKK